MKISLHLKRTLLLLTGIASFASIYGQNCDPNNTANLSLPYLNEAVVLQKLQSVRPAYDATDIKAVRETLGRCNVQIETELLAIEQQLNEASLQMQDILAAKDISKLEEQLLALQQSRTASQKELDGNMAGTKHCGIFVVLLNGIDPYANKNDLIAQAQNALTLKAIQNLNGVSIRRLTTVTDLREVKDVIESFSGGEVNAAEVMSDKPIYTKKIFLYAAKVYVSPLKNNPPNKAVIGGAITTTVIDAINDSNWEDQLRSAGVNEDAVIDLSTRIRNRILGINTENTQADRSQEAVARRGVESIAKIDLQMQEIRRLIADAKATIQKTLYNLGFSFNENNIPGSVNVALDAQRKAIEKLRQNWNNTKSREYLSKSALVEINGDPFTALAPEVMRLVKNLNDSYGNIKKNAELTKIENLLVTEYNNTAAAETYREVEKIWIFPTPQDDGTFQLNVWARFKVASKLNTNVNNSTTTTSSSYTSPANTSTSSSSYTEYSISPSFKMIAIPAGTFTMGCTSEQGSDCWDSEKPSHRVGLSAFNIMETEVTQAQWRAVMGNNPSNFSDCDDCPVENVSWDDIQIFLSKLNTKCSKRYRLPTEAEWEYAARGGQNYKYAGSNTIDDVAWYSSNSGSKTHSVKGKLANGYGLYDMTGNVCEWNSDWYGSDYYGNSSYSNPGGASSGTDRDRVIRGGSWYLDRQMCRLASRNSYTLDNRDNFIGFRLVSSISDNSTNSIAKTTYVSPRSPVPSTPFATYIETSITGSIKMLAIPAGTFMMGSNNGKADEKPLHSITLSPFYISETEVTQAQWRTVMGNNPSTSSICDDCPVDNVSWEDAQLFIQKLNGKCNGKHYRLPTEAEWEYASRGGQSYQYSGIDNLAVVNSFYGDGSIVTKYIRHRSPNSYGLCMMGTIFEWCADWYASDYYVNSLSNNPQGASTGTYRVLRGGGNSQGCPRYGNVPVTRLPNYGFRLVASQ